MEISQHARYTWYVESNTQRWYPGWKRRKLRIPRRNKTKKRGGQHDKGESGNYKNNSKLTRVILTALSAVVTPSAVLPSVSGTALAARRPWPVVLTRLRKFFTARTIRFQQKKKKETTHHEETNFPNIISFQKNTVPPPLLPSALLCAVSVRSLKSKWWWNGFDGWQTHRIRKEGVWAQKSWRFISCSGCNKG